MRLLRLGAAIVVLAACGGANAQQSGRGAPAPDLCDAFSELFTRAAEFSTAFAEGTDDLDGDGLPDVASLALVREVACNSDSPEALSSSTATAYAANLAFFDAELDTAGLDGFREAIAVLMLTSATTEAAVKAAVAAAAPPVTLSADYTQVTCAGELCMPTPTRNTAVTGEFLDFAPGPRAPDEPYAGDGDLDADTVTNLTEYENIEAQGGDLGDFVIAATSAELDGTEPVRSSGGGGGCFIASAAYGTPLASQVDVLRHWRDEALLVNGAGTAFADVYYRLSPAAAAWVTESGMLAAATRVVLVPVVLLARGESLLLTITAAIALLAGMCILHRPPIRFRRKRARTGAQG